MVRRPQFNGRAHAGMGQIGNNRIRFTSQGGHAVKRLPDLFVPVKNAVGVQRPGIGNLNAGDMLLQHLGNGQPILLAVNLVIGS